MPGARRRCRRAGAAAVAEDKAELLFHPLDEGNHDVSSPYYFNYALTLLDMNSHFSTAYQLSARPKAFSSTPDGRVGFYIMENRPYLEVLAVCS